MEVVHVLKNGERVSSIDGIKVKVPANLLRRNQAHIFLNELSKNRECSEEVNEVK